MQETRPGPKGEHIDNSSPNQAVREDLALLYMLGVSAPLSIEARETVYKKPVYEKSV